MDLIFFASIETNKRSQCLALWNTGHAISIGPRTNMLYKIIKVPRLHPVFTLSNKTRASQIMTWYLTTMEFLICFLTANVNHVTANHTVFLDLKIGFPYESYVTCILAENLVHNVNVTIFSHPFTD